jgi:F0F1-type ATP synthase membrane subunit c/vacuolar-type H+-ATPase subunit K
MTARYFADALPVLLGLLSGVGLGFMGAMMLHSTTREPAPECTLDDALARFPECELVCVL